MTHPASIISVPVLACVLGSSGLARAQQIPSPSANGSLPNGGDPTAVEADTTSPDLPGATPRPPRVGVLATGALGSVHYYSPEASPAGMVTGAQVLIRWRYFATGVGAEAQGSYGVTAEQVHALAGLSLYNAGRLRLDALGLLGTHHYSRWGGNDIFSDDPGASGSLPVVGGRMALAYEPYVKRGPHVFGSFTAGYQDDLGRETVSYEYTDTSSWTGDNGTETGEHTLGAKMMYLGLGVGVEFDVSSGG